MVSCSLLSLNVYISVSLALAFGQATITSKRFALNGNLFYFSSYSVRFVVALIRLSDSNSLLDGLLLLFLVLVSCV